MLQTGAALLLQSGAGSITKWSRYYKVGQVLLQSGAGITKLGIITKWCITPPNFCVPKRVRTPKGDQIGPKFVFPVLQLEIPWSHVYSPNLKQNGWKLLHLWPTALSGTQNFPISICPLSDRYCKFTHCHILDIIMQNVTAKLQMSRISGSTDMRPRT